ncbi:hypothetical protein PsorP6_011977 [Peronosclerospora sorghi]|uniref:Uncharacterized protein n=1 Tax=Peronosclerospora sorghi TaxID=230839 RepID=A0ACC0WJH6_9STRA|nr:hypothetical protein PsorP6_011977 [Peronosclerospora sorghi]
MLASKVDRLLQIVAARGAPPFTLDKTVVPINNVVAFSGGVDSSLAAALVFQVFPTTSAACIGKSPALSSVQLQQAREVAHHIGIPLWESHTHENKIKGYVANQGNSCYYCKTTLYSTLNQVADFAWKEMHHQMGNKSSQGPKLTSVIYNGTNADDHLDPTRVGLRAASEFNVVSPLSELTKQDVRDVAKYLGLPNWNAAASPCLRSRLQFGVEATKHHLRQVEKAEDFLRTLLCLTPQMNLRVRLLAGNKAAVELDPDALEEAIAHFDAINTALRRLGFDAVDIRAFRTGSLSGYNATSLLAKIRKNPMAV